MATSLSSFVRRHGCAGLLLATLALALSSCAGDGHLSSEGSSDPVNGSESNEYARALLRCHKTGGTRVVKVEGSLRCY